MTGGDEQARSKRGPRRAEVAASRRAGRPPPGTAPRDTAGGVLERRIARLEFAEGALARLRIPVPAEGAESGRDVLTDIDVLSIDIDLRLRMSRSSLECKNGKGHSGEPMTLVWLAGFRQLLRLDRVVFVRPAVTSRGRALARRLGIPVLDESTIVAREKAHRWLPERFAHLDGEACAAAEAQTDLQLKGLPDVPASLAQFLRGEALLASSPALLAAVESLGAATARQGALPEPAATVLASHALIAVLLAAIQDASRLDESSHRALRVRLERALTTGDPDDEHLLPLLERADALVRHVVERTHRAYVDAGADPIRIEMPSLRATVAAPPGYLDDYLDFVTRLRANPLVARDLLQTSELACFEGLLGGDAWQAPAFAHLFTAEHHGLLLVAQRCLGQIAGPQIAGALDDLTSLRFPGDDGRVPDRRGSYTRPVTADGPSRSPHGPASVPAPTMRAGSPPSIGQPRPAGRAEQNPANTAVIINNADSDRTAPGSGHAVKLPFDEAGEDPAAGRLWGKSQAQGSKHLLFGHLLDTAAAAELLWDHFVAAALRDRVDGWCGGQGRSLFALLCALHDIGKATPEFQRREDVLADQPQAGGGDRRRDTPGREIRSHHAHAGAVIVSRYLDAAGWKAPARDWVSPLIALHHGLTPATGRLPPSSQVAAETGPWLQAQQALIGRVARELTVDLASFRDLPTPPKASQLALAGLITMADWIASDELHFAGQPEVSMVSLDASRSRAWSAWQQLGLHAGWRRDLPAPSDQPDLVRHRFAVPARPVQAGAIRMAREMPAPGLLILEAPTGEGKTEAALAVAEVLARRFGADGVFIGMPSQATADQMYSRVRAWSASVDPDVPIGFVHGSARAIRQWAALRSQIRFSGIGEDLDDDRTGKDLDTSAGGEGSNRDGAEIAAQWLIGPKRALLAPVTVGPVDQLLQAATGTKHVMLRHAAVAGRVVILDEVHAFDASGDQFMLEALRWLADAGCPVILLSVALPPPLRTRLARAYLQGATQTSEVTVTDLPAAHDYPWVTAVCTADGRPDVAAASWPSWQSSRPVRVEILEETEVYDPAVLATAVGIEVEAGGCALVVCNTVTRAQDVYTALQPRFGDDVVLLHSRLVDVERVARTERVIRLLGQPGPAHYRPRRLVVVATQLAEQSFDIDADLLITDLAPIDLLLQRIGRVHRFGRPAAERPPRLRDPKVIVSGLHMPAGDTPRWPNGSRAVYGDYPLLRSTALVTEAAARGGWSLPADIPRLVAAGYGYEPLGPPAWANAASAAQQELSEKVRRRDVNAAGLLLGGEIALGKPTVECLRESSALSVNEHQIMAVIQDDDESIEVVLVRRSPAGYLTLAGRPIGINGEAISDDRILEEVLGATLRLPASNEIATTAATELGPLPGWPLGDPWLGRARALVLDDNMSATLGAYRFTYDPQIGLRHRRVRDRRATST